MNIAYRHIIFSALIIVGSAANVNSSQSQTTYFIENGKTIAKLGAYSTGFYVSFIEPLGQNCQHGNVFISLDRKGIYAELLAAKITGKRLSRFDYSQPAGNGTNCNAELAEFMD